MLSIRGIFHNGTAQPVEAIEGYEGQPVLITFVQMDDTTLAPDACVDESDTLGQLIDNCKVHTGIGDLAHQHDHYIHGTSRRGSEPA